MRRRNARGWPAALSLALHLSVFLALLVSPRVRQPTDVADTFAVDLVADGGAAQGTPEPPAPPEAAPTAPTAPAEAAPPPAEPPQPVQQLETPSPPAAPEVPPVQQAEPPPPPSTPAPAPEVPPPPPVQHVETPPPTPAPEPQVPPPPPVQKAVIPPPPAPAPMHVAPVTPAHPPPRRVAARPATVRAVNNTAEALAHATDQQAASPGETGAGHASAANNGAAWMGKLKQWWDQHSFYPKEASLTNEGGAVRARIIIAADGQVTSIEVVQGSGSSVLDAAAVAVFRNAHLPPFPPGTPAQPADVVVTLHYRPSDGGG